MIRTRSRTVPRLLDSISPGVSAQPPRRAERKINPARVEALGNVVATEKIVRKRATATPASVRLGRGTPARVGFRALRMTSRGSLGPSVWRRGEGVVKEIAWNHDHGATFTSEPNEAHHISTKWRRDALSRPLCQEGVLVLFSREGSRTTLQSNPGGNGCSPTRYRRHEDCW